MHGVRILTSVEISQRCQTPGFQCMLQEELISLPYPIPCIFGPLHTYVVLQQCLLISPCLLQSSSLQQEASANFLILLRHIFPSKDMISKLLTFAMSNRVALHFESMVVWCCQEVADIHILWKKMSVGTFVTYSINNKKPLCTHSCIVVYWLLLCQKSFIAKRINITKYI